MGGKDHFWDTVITVFGGLATIGLVAVLVSKNANTAAIVQNTFSGYGNALLAAEAPVTGSTSGPNLSYASEGLGGNLGFTPTFGGGFG